MIRRFLTTFTAAAVSLAVASSAHAAVFIPNKTTDSADGACDQQDCSLREAILAANQSPGDDVVLLHKGVYTLTIPGKEDLGAAGDLDILGNLILLGDGASSTSIGGGGIDRIFQIPGGVTFEIRDVTLRDGMVSGNGGAILNAGNLTIARSTLSTNISSIGVAGTGFGGSIYSNGSNASLTMTGSTIIGSTAEAGGGGIAAGGTVSLANDTISNNTASAGFGGGLFLYTTARATLNNLTVTLNTALRGGGITVENTPFIGVTPRISNSILATNLASTQPDCFGPLDSTYNLVSSADPFCIGPSAATHDIVGTSPPIDAKLLITQPAGGPTNTRALLPGSPAIDAGNPAVPGSGGRACEATDQRGAARPGTGTGSSRCDMGAYELTSSCVAGGPFLCLSGDRFQVTAVWTAFLLPSHPVEGSAQGFEFTPDSGYFWFFDPSNVELTVKVLNACTFNNKFWVFLSGLTDVKVDIKVTDTQTGVTKTYSSPAGQTFKTTLDTSAFDCP